MDVASTRKETNHFGCQYKPFGNCLRDSLENKKQVSIPCGFFWLVLCSSLFTGAKLWQIDLAITFQKRPDSLWQESRPGGKRPLFLDQLPFGMVNVQLP